MERITLTPLTAEEQVFAAEHHNLVYHYLHIRKLPVEDWYDIVVFPYLRAIKKWFEQPELQRWKFSTVAYNAMRCAIGNEREKQKRRIQTVSLDEVIAETESFAYGNTITYEHLRYIPYVTYGEEDMNIQYNVTLPERINRGNKSEELLAIEEFLIGSEKNMCFEYKTKEEAKKKYDTIRKIQIRKNHQEYYQVCRIGPCIYIVRLKEIKGKEKA